MSPKSAPSPHLNPADGLHGARGLGQGGVAGRLPPLPDGILEVFRLLAQLLQLIHGGEPAADTGGGGWCRVALCPGDQLARVTLCPGDQPSPISRRGAG